MVEITNRTHVMIGTGLTAIIVVTLFLFNPATGDEGSISYSRPDYATCGLTSCYIDYNISNGYPSAITISTDGITATDAKGLLTAPEAHREQITDKTEDIYSDVEKSFKCDYEVIATSVSANATKKCVRAKDGKEEVLFDKVYESYDDKTKTFVYNEHEKTGERVVEETSYVQDSLTLQPGEWLIYRVSFDVPINTWGKFTTIICFIVDGEEICIEDDPYWNTSLRWSRPTYSWALNVTNMSSSVVLPINGTSAVTVNGTTLWVYALGNGKFYFNSATDYDFNDNGFGKNLMFQTTGTPAEPATTLDTNLRAYYPLDEASGTTAQDFSGRNNDGTIRNGAVVNQTGKVFKAITFDGANDDISIPNPSLGTADFTICGWFNLDTNATTENVFGQWNTAPYTQMRVTLNDVEGLLFTIYQDATHLYDCRASTVGLYAATWHHFCFVRTGGATGTWYANGVNLTTALHMHTSTMQSAAVTHFIGSIDDANPLDGMIDDFQIYTRALSLSEIQAIYNLKASTMTTNTRPTESWNANGDYDHRRVVDLSDTLMLPVNGTTTTSVNGTAVMLYAKGDQDEFDYLYYNTSALKAIQNQTSTGTGLEWFLTLPASHGTTTYSVTTDPVLHLPLDEASGTTAEDFSGNGLDGTNTGTATIAEDGKVFNSYYFDGTTDYINLTSSVASLDFNSPFSISYWANNNFSHKDAGTHAIYEIVNNLTGTSQNKFVIWSGETWVADEIFGVTVKKTGANPGTARVYSYSSASNFQNVWTHWVLTGDGTTYVLYLNGSIVNLASPYGTGAYNGDYGDDITTTQAVLGIELAGSTISSYYKGWIDDFRLYPRALSEDEIRQLYTLHGKIGDEETYITPAPVLTWNWTHNQSSNYPIELNITISSDSAFDVCLLEIDGSNVTMLEVNDTYAYYNYTPAVGNHTQKAYCNNSAGWGQTYEAWYNINDATPPSLDWNWTDINSTITVNWTFMCVNASETLTNCTFRLNNTETYANTTDGTNLCYNFTSLNDGNYTNVNATCYDLAGNDAMTYNAWVEVDTTLLCTINVSISWNPYGASTIEYYPKTNTSTQVAALGQIDLPYANQATGKTASANDSNSSHLAAATIDGNTSTYWVTNSSSPDGAWWMLDLGATIDNITLIKYYFTKSDEASHFFNISYGTSTSSMVTDTWGWGRMANNATWYSLKIMDPISARYINLSFANFVENLSGVMTDYTTELGGLAEFEVYRGVNGLYGRGIVNVTVDVNATVYVSVSELNANITEKANTGYIYSSAASLSTALVNIGTMLAGDGYIWFWADFSGDVEDPYFERNLTFTCVAT